jgi:hypothetical protein
MFALVRRFLHPIPRTYQSLASDNPSQDEEIPRAEKPRFSTSSRHITILYTTIVLLLVTQLVSIQRIRSEQQHSPLGSYETSFTTELRMLPQLESLSRKEILIRYLGPDRNALSLHKVKFYGGIVFDENGTASVSHRPGEPDYFGLPSEETEIAWERLLNSMYCCGTSTLAWRKISDPHSARSLS